ncbi:hypothetical protein Tco_1501017 [Tanacetum coccineum]
MGAGSQERPSEPAPLAQTTHSPSFIKENIKVLKTMIKEHDQQAKTKGTSKKLVYDESEEGDSASRGTKGMSEQLCLGSSNTFRAHNRVRSSIKGQRSLSHGKTTSQPRRESRPKYQEISSDSESEEDSEYSYEDLSTPYKRPNPTPFMTQITRFKYHQRAKLPRNIKVHEGKKDPKDHLSIFSAATELEEWPMPVCKMVRQGSNGNPSHQKEADEGLQVFMDRFKSESSHIKGVPPVLRISAFMHGHGNPERAKKLNDKIPKTVDEMFERVRAFIRGEIVAGSAEATRPPQ